MEDESSTKRTLRDQENQKTRSSEEHEEHHKYRKPENEEHEEQRDDNFLETSRGKYVGCIFNFVVITHLRSLEVTGGH